MKYCFDWKIVNYGIVRCYHDDFLAALITIDHRCYVYLYKNGSCNAFKDIKNIDDAKKWCDEELNKIGIKILSEEYKVLL
jgi:hypothetical protein